MTAKGAYAQKLMEKFKIQHVYNNEAIDHREDVHKSGDPACFFFYSGK